MTMMTMMTTMETGDNDVDDDRYELIKIVHMLLNDDDTMTLIDLK